MGLLGCRLEITVWLYVFNAKTNSMDSIGSIDMSAVR